MSTYAMVWRDAKLEKNLRLFGEIGIVRKGGLLSKVENKGLVGMMVGYGEENGTGSFRMLNMRTRRIIITRDVGWLEIKYGEWVKKAKEMESVDSNTTRSESLLVLEKEEAKDKEEG